MKIVCPRCGGVAESDVSPGHGERVQCPYCDAVFAYSNFRKAQKESSCLMRLVMAVFYVACIFDALQHCVRFGLNGYVITALAIPLGVYWFWKNFPRMRVLVSILCGLFCLLGVSGFIESFGEKGGRDMSRLTGNPFVFKMGSRPLGELSDDRIVTYPVTDYLGIRKAVLAYTSRNRLAGICLIGQTEGLDVRWSDERVRQLIRDCDGYCPGIQWESSRNAIGGLFAMGRKYDSSGRLEIIVAVIPNWNSNDNTMGLQVNVINAKLKRVDDGDTSLENM